VTDADHYSEFIGRLTAAMRSADIAKEFLSRCRGALLPPPDNVSGPEAGECVMLWGLDYDRYQFSVTAKTGYSLAWGDLRPDGVESGETRNVATVIDRLFSHLKTKEVASEWDREPVI